MDSPALAFFTILGTVFVCSFIILILLCRYKSIRKNATRYVKKLARSDLRKKEMELIEHRADRVKRFLRPLTCVGAISDKCKQLLELCYDLDLNVNMLTEPDKQKLYAIIQVAKSITEESDWRSTEGRERAALLNTRTVGLLQQVSSALAAMEARLNALKESSIQDHKQPSCSYQNSLII